MKDLIYKILKESEFDWVESPFGIDDNLMNYLIKNFPTNNYPKNAAKFLGDKYVVIDEKPYPLESNKKRITNKIYWGVVDEFPNINEPVLRRTIRTFLNNANGN